MYLNLYHLQSRIRISTTTDQTQPIILMNNINHKLIITCKNKQKHFEKFTKLKMKSFLKHVNITSFCFLLGGSIGVLYSSNILKNNNNYILIKQSGKRK